MKKIASTIMDWFNRVLIVVKMMHRKAMAALMQDYIKEHDIPVVGLDSIDVWDDPVYFYTGFSIYIFFLSKGCKIFRVNKNFN